MALCSVHARMRTQSRCTPHSPCCTPRRASKLPSTQSTSKLCMIYVTRSTPRKLSSAGQYLGAVCLGLRVHLREIRYSTGPTLNTYSALIQNFYSQETAPYPAVHLALNTGTDQGEEPGVKAYVRCQKYNLDRYPTFLANKIKLALQSV